MNSTDLDTPPLKLILIAIVIVVGLHVLTAVALVAMKPAEPTIKPPVDTPPIEIEFVSLPAPNTEPEIEAEQAAAQQKTQSKVKPERIEPPKPQPQQKPIAESNTKVVTVKPTIKTLEIKNKKADIEPVAKVERKKPGIIKKEAPKIDTSMADEQRRIIAAQAEKAAQDAHARAVVDAKAAREAQAQADAKAANDAAKKSAEIKAAIQAAEAAVRAKADAAAKAAASASNEPVNFTASNANWASAPNFSFPERAAKRARSGDTLNVVLVLRVNKQGSIDSVRIVQSSGNAIVDKEAQRQVRSGKFKPFTKNGVPVVGNVTLPIAYAIP
ncbi:colicin import membrane protein/protein TonB [Psychrobacter luti]|uniref:Colicin import membrane protein/protein TonB n=1 Tax=Psychrobacter luti TaxID=198481 RepID=A0A839TDC3_9GAMM|nr:energy transducer TonB [Psychrobacter luti]MBB3107178.1 colicin import membrane protein/protein TonB [Psychrobacter luti]